MHDPDYRQSWKDWESFVDALSEKIAEVDETVPELPPKDLVIILLSIQRAQLKHGDLQVFRIYRDIRFSPDPTPYKVSPSLNLSNYSANAVIDAFQCGVVSQRMPVACVVSNQLMRSRTGRKGPYAACTLQVLCCKIFY